MRRRIAKPMTHDYATVEENAELYAKVERSAKCAVPYGYTRYHLPLRYPPEKAYATDNTHR